MTRSCALLLTAFAAGLLSGCGDPAPSTTLAPDRKMPDVSKMSKDQVDSLLKQNPTAGRK